MLKTSSLLLGLMLAYVLLVVSGPSQADPLEFAVVGAGHCDCDATTLIPCNSSTQDPNCGGDVKACVAGNDYNSSASTNEVCKMNDMDCTQLWDVVLGNKCS